jgi:hypothetical protein
MSKMSRRIVVDASVARSAGSTEHPASVHSRQFLQEMLTICHRVVMTDEIAREWRSHRSLFAARWLAAMRSKRKVVTVDPEGRSGLLELLPGSGLGPNQRAAVEKDCLLVTAAWAADDLVASNDDKIRRLLCRLVAGSADLGRVVWVNPTAPEETPIEWLRSGARSATARTLGSLPRQRQGG